MKMKDVYSAACKFAPIEFSEAFVKLEDGYDNSGIILETDRDIKRVLFALDLTLGCARYAAEGGFDLVITHHPAIYYPIKRLDNAGNRALLTLAKNGIGVISMHLNLDIADSGIDCSLAEGLGAKEQRILTAVSGDNGYGRFFEIAPVSLSQFKENIKKTFGTDNVMIFGDRNRIISKVASFCGAGCDVGEADLASGADAIVSADFKHHVILHALEKGMCVVQMTHYASENYGMKRFCAAVTKDLGLYTEYFEEKVF